ncbi:APH-domain-containing protein, partial [Aureobasidium melanogenum]
MQPLPRASPYIIRRFWGIVHKKLMRFSHLYCRWYGISFSNQIIQLPFGLLIKWSDGTRIEEVLAMEAARKAGMPVPRVICYGEHPDMPHAPVSILMTRLPGHELGEVYKSLSQTEKDTVLFEMKAYLSSMRRWKSPWGEHRICSSSGTSIRSVRVPLISMGPFETEQEMNDYLLYPAGLDMYDNDQKKSHVSGFIDWESAGWYPDYWEFTTALRFQYEDFWWYDFVLRLSDHKYLVYKDAEQALTRITGDWYAW